MRPETAVPTLPAVSPPARQSAPLLRLLLPGLCFPGPHSLPPRTLVGPEPKRLGEHLLGQKDDAVLRPPAINDRQFFDLA